MLHVQSTRFHQKVCHTSTLVGVLPHMNMALCMSAIGLNLLLVSVALMIEEISSSQNTMHGIHQPLHPTLPLGEIILTLMMLLWLVEELMMCRWYTLILGSLTHHLPYVRRLGGANWRLMKMLLLPMPMMVGTSNPFRPTNGKT